MRCQSLQTLSFVVIKHGCFIIFYLLYRLYALENNYLGSFCLRLVNNPDYDSLNCTKVLISEAHYITVQQGQNI